MEKIVKMGSKHLDEVIALGLSTPELQTGTDAPQFYQRETLERWCHSPHSILLVTISDDSVVGFSLTAYNPDSRDGYIHCMALKPGYRSKTLGSQMLAYTLDELQKMGCNHVYTLVQTTNEKTLGFMRTHGFQVGQPFNYVQRCLP